MKKIALAGLVAFALIAISQHQASAWTNTKFGIGLNFERQSGGNSAIWGLWRNGQPPGPDSFQPAPAGVFPFHGPRMMPAQMMVPPAAGAVPAPVGFPVQGASYEQYNSNMSFANPYQFANYPRGYYYNNNMYYGR